jgi:hypothetical protein
LGSISGLPGVAVAALGAQGLAACALLGEVPIAIKAAVSVMEAADTTNRDFFVIFRHLPSFGNCLLHGWVFARDQEKVTCSFSSNRKFALKIEKRGIVSLAMDS